MAVSDAYSKAEIAQFHALAAKSLEDHRGVDISQIRDRLRLTPAQRLRRMVHEVRTITDIVEFANQTN